MGATNFQLKSKGKSASEAYRSAVEDAVDEHGNDPYNGTISTTHGYVDKTADYKRSKKKLEQYIEDNCDKTEKWGDCFAICIKEPKLNTLKVKSQVENHVEKGTKKWLTKYAIYAGLDNCIGMKDTKTEAVKVAREYTERTTYRTSVVIEKVLESGSSKVADITYKKSATESNGEYIFFGWAAC